MLIVGCQEDVSQSKTSQKAAVNTIETAIKTDEVDE